MGRISEIFKLAWIITNMDELKKIGNYAVIPFFLSLLLIMVIPHENGIVAIILTLLFIVSFVNIFYQFCVLDRLSKRDAYVKKRLEFFSGRNFWITMIFIIIAFVGIDIIIYSMNIFYKLNLLVSSIITLVLAMLFYLFYQKYILKN